MYLARCYGYDCCAIAILPYRVSRGYLAHVFIQTRMHAQRVAGVCERAVDMRLGRECERRVDLAPRQLRARACVLAGC